ncbi:MAG: multiple sugar transport system permease protein [Rhodothermales bacterium]|jgi:multiple sugar transport system permease protein
MTRSEKRDLRNGLLFCGPWIIGLSLFMLYPLAASVYYSFCDYSVLLPPVFVGVSNYVDLFQDPIFWQSLWNTLFFAVGSVVLGLGAALILALLLNCRVRGITFYRTIFFLPTLVPIVAGSILWMWMYNGDNGIINTLLGQIGIQGPAWLGDPRFAKIAIVIMSVWAVGHAMIIMLAGLQDVPVALQEAAIIDGANFWQRLLHVTLPMITPVIFFNLIMGIIGGLQVFTQAFIMTGATGAPERSTLFYVLHLYNVGFEDLRMGYACAMAWILFLLILGLTLLVIRGSKRWVTYDR